jgi:D-arabinose 1-dehydrogenase-like Zn-dependent alcohol dehydrogenase
MLISQRAQKRKQEPYWAKEGNEVVQAAVFKALGQPFSIEQVPDPVPGPEDVLIKVGRCGICGKTLIDVWASA